MRVSNDGLVYVCDRDNDRIQVFRKDGRFIREFIVEAQTLQNGSTWDMTLSPDSGQRYLYVADGANGAVYILSRADGSKLGSFGHTGRYTGEFKWVHNIDVVEEGQHLHGGSRLGVLLLGSFRIAGWGSRSGGT